MCFLIFNKLIERFIFIQIRNILVYQIFVWFGNSILEFFDLIPYFISNYDSHVTLYILLILIRKYRDISNILLKLKFLKLFQNSRQYSSVLLFFCIVFFKFLILHFLNENLKLFYCFIQHHS